MTTFKNQKGFGLLSAFFLVTILAGIVAGLLNFMSYSNKAQMNAQDVSDLQTCKMSIESRLDAAARNSRALSVSKNFSWATGLNNTYLKSCLEQTATCTANPSFTSTPTSSTTSYRLGYPFFLFDPLSFPTSTPTTSTDYTNNINGLLAGWPANTTSSPSWYGVRYKYNPRCEPCTQAEMASDTTNTLCPLIAIALFNPSDCNTTTGRCESFQINTRVYKLPMNLTQLNDNTPTNLAGKTTPPPLTRAPTLSTTATAGTINKSPSFQFTVNSTTSFTTYEPRICFYVTAGDNLTTTTTQYLACNTGITSVCGVGGVTTNCIATSSQNNLRPFTNVSGFYQNDATSPSGTYNVTPPVTITSSHATVGSYLTAYRPCKLRFGFHVFVPLKTESASNGTFFTNYASFYQNRFYKCNANSTSSTFGTATTALFDNGQWNSTNNYIGNRYVNRPCGLYDVTTDAPRTTYYRPRSTGSDPDSRSSQFITASTFTTGTTFRAVDITYLQNTRMEIENRGSNSLVLNLIDGGAWGATYQASDFATRMQVQVDLLPDADGKYCEITDPTASSY